MSLVKLTLAAVPPEIAKELGAVEDLEAKLEALRRRGEASLPDVAVDHRAWAEHLARHLVAGDVAKQLSEMNADVHLALACLARNPHALAELQRRIRSIAPRALTGMSLEASTMTELQQNVFERLVISESGASLPKIGGYAGRGPLDSWLRVTVARAALSAIRQRGPEDARREEVDALLSHAASDDPELEALRQRCGPALKKAIEEAVAALSDQDRVVLRLHMVDGLTIDDLASVYGKHRATTARHLARVRSAIFEGARQRAVAQLGIGEAEFASLMGVMLSRIDVTIRRFLGDGESASS